MTGQKKTWNHDRCGFRKGSLLKVWIVLASWFLFENTWETDKLLQAQSRRYRTDTDWDFWLISLIRMNIDSHDLLAAIARSNPCSWEIFSFIGFPSGRFVSITSIYVLLWAGLLRCLHQPLFLPPPPPAPFSSSSFSFPFFFLLFLFSSSSSSASSSFLFFFLLCALLLLLLLLFLLLLILFLPRFFFFYLPPPPTPPSPSPPPPSLRVLDCPHLFTYGMLNVADGKFKSRWADLPNFSLFCVSSLPLFSHFFLFFSR